MCDILWVYLFSQIKSLVSIIFSNGEAMWCLAVLDEFCGSGISSLYGVKNQIRFRTLQNSDEAPPWS